MVIWNGLGFVVGIIAIACLVISQQLMGEAWGSSNLGKSGAFIAAAILTFGFDKFLQSRRKDKILMDKETGKDVVLRKSDSLFFIPVKFWPIIFVVIAVIIPIATKFG